MGVVGYFGKKKLMHKFKTILRLCWLCLMRGGDVVGDDKLVDDEGMVEGEMGDEIDSGR